MLRIPVIATVAATALLSAASLFGAGAPGAVYTATNAATGNQINVYDRSADGQLALVGAAGTGGVGTGGGLGNQGGLRLTRGGQFLLAVNAGSNDVSVLRVSGAGLELVDVVPSGGLQPISIAVDGRLVYVLNAGGSVGDVDRLVGFRLSPAGNLSAIPGAMSALSQAMTDPAQVEFSADGARLVVTEKATDMIDVFEVGPAGTIVSGMAHPSAGATPFGFAFGKRGQFFVSEAFGGASDASAVTSYDLSAMGTPVAISPSVPTTETAACWVAVSNHGRTLYTTNTGSGSITGYSIDPDGTIDRLDADGVTASTGTGSSPIDLAFAVNDRYLYSLNAGNGTISAFRILPHGHLDPVGTTFGLPAGANGLAAQ